MKKERSVLLITLLITLSYSLEQCSFEFLNQDDVNAYVSFGDPDCVFGDDVPRSVEMWIKPLENGGSFSEGIIFDSGKFTTVGGKVLSFTLSIKSHGQLFGVIWEMESGSDRPREIISGSHDGLIHPNVWTHVMWIPYANKFYLNSTLSQKAVINGNSLIGINDFNPGTTIKIGRSFHGRISLVRLWSNEISDIQSFYEEDIDCDLKSNLIAYWDFSQCKQFSISDFTSRTCGYPYPSEEHFLWYNMDAPPSLAAYRFHTLCEIESSCNENCAKEEQEESTFNTQEAHHFTPSSSMTLPANFMITIAAATLFFLVAILSCFCCKKKKLVPYNKVELQDEESFQNHTLSPIYIKN
eukprot:TRINITY_DN616_c0_g1_i1.p1 TRINITY_DN616_c0_g1~~TRINITY_DN616_c0_g1_i1.p1  ORF type:complete len:354 (+),score=71.53 TRINITY_DN616_c0_g1_i1:48-1109(+)